VPDRRLPYARTLAVLRVLSWPYRYPPLSWYVTFIDWVAAKNSRMFAVGFMLAAILAWTFVIKVVIYRG